MKIIGQVIHGEGRGKRMGSPTLNMDSKPHALPFGVYVCNAFIGQKKYPAVMSWGSRPTFEETTPILEVFLLDGEGDFYGASVEVEVGPMLRELRRFASPHELQLQIAEDVRRAKDHLN